MPRQSDDDREWAAIAYAREQLGYTVTDANRHLFTAAEVAAWGNCVQEFLDRDE